jgi:hypothetical protein
LGAQDFPNPPVSYYEEMGKQPLSTIMLILKNRGAYTDLHYLKQGTRRVEGSLLLSDGRAFNINPGSVGTYGVCLASHKPTGGRPDGMPWRWHHYALTFSQQSYYERIMRWENQRLVPIEDIAKGNKFPEYFEQSRVSRFEGLIQTLEDSNQSVALMADK